MANLSKRYSHEFKESIVSLHQTGGSANSLSKEYGVSVSSITFWIKQADPNDTSVLSVNEKQLIKENKRLKMVKKINKPKSYVTEAQRPNLVKKKVDQLNVLLTDITYIRVKQKWVYLASLYNPRTRRVIAHKVSENMTKELATSVIEKNKIKQLGINIIHSDMGSQYTIDLFEKTLVQYGVKHSYSRKGCPGDNARIESFHSIHEVIAGIDQYIRWYNNERISLVA